MIKLQIFQSEWLTFVFYFSFIMLFVGIAEVIRKKNLMSAESSRRFVHIGVGILVSTAPFLFTASIQALVLAVVFTTMLYITLQLDRFKGMHATARKSFGTVFFPISFIILILLYWYRDPAILILGMMIMTFSDPLASIVGEKMDSDFSFVFWKDKKTLPGSLTLFVTSFLVTVFGLIILRKINGQAVPVISSLLLIGIITATVATLSESISHAGSDNLTLPILSAITIDVLLSQTIAQQLTVLLWILGSGAIFYFAYKLKSLTAGGTAGAMLLGIIIFMIGGVFWIIPMLTFFILSSLLSKFGKAKKAQLKNMVEKGSQRDVLQVYANGGVAMIMVICYHFTNNMTFFYMFLGAMAAATADTWGTELGIFAKMKPRHIINFTTVEPGSSGGISILGTTFVMLGSIVLTFSGITLLFESWVKVFVIIAVSGVCGALIDSILGGTIQAQYRCPNCNKKTEKLVHCGEYETKLISGIRWIDNDIVNFSCTASGALIVLLLTKIFI